MHIQADTFASPPVGAGVMVIGAGVGPGLVTGTVVGAGVKAVAGVGAGVETGAGVGARVVTKNGFGAGVGRPGQNSGQIFKLVVSRLYSPEPS